MHIRKLSCTTQVGIDWKSTNGCYHKLTIMTISIVRNFYLLSKIYHTLITTTDNSSVHTTESNKIYHIFLIEMRKNIMRKCVSTNINTHIEKCYANMLISHHLKRLQYRKRFMGINLLYFNKMFSFYLKPSPFRF